MRDSVAARAGRRRRPPPPISRRCACRCTPSWRSTTSLLRGLDAEKALLDASVIAFERALELTQNRFRGGIASQADVAQAETQLEATRAQAIDG